MNTKSKYLMKVIKAYLIDVFLWSYTALCMYKVIWQKFILDLRYPEFTWTQPLFSLFVGLALAFVFFPAKRCSLGKRALGLYIPHDLTPLRKKYYVFWGLFVLVLTLVVSFHTTQLSLRELLSPDGLQGAARIFSSLIRPEFSILQITVLATIETIYMAFLATVFAIPVAFVLNFFAAKNLATKTRFFSAVYAILRFTMNITRSIEPIVWAIIFSVWVGIGPFAGMLALMVHSVASLVKLYSEQVESINEGPLEAMTATGAHPILVVWFGVVPQIILPFLSYTIYRWDINVRMATIIGLVGGGGIGTLLMQYQGLAKWNEVGLIIMVIAATVWIMDYASAKIRELIK